MLGEVFIPPIVPATPFQLVVVDNHETTDFGEIYISTLLHREEGKTEIPILSKLDEEWEGQKRQKGWTPCQLEEADERLGREGSWAGTSVWEGAKSAPLVPSGCSSEQEPDGEQQAGVAWDRSNLAEAEVRLNKFD